MYMMLKTDVENLANHIFGFVFHYMIASHVSSRNSLLKAQICAK